MRRMLRVGLAMSAVALVCLASKTARADELVVRTRELGSWNDALDALRRDLGAEGRVLHLRVLAGDERVACGRYRLGFDDDALRAFRVGSCDPSNQETAVTLTRRAALFDERFHVPRPRTLSVTATIETTVVASGAPEGGSAVHCSISVQPYLDDFLHGRRVPLTPDRYALRPGATNVTVSPSVSGWTLETTSKASIHLRYEVVERATGDVVLREDTTLVCGVESERDKLGVFVLEPAADGHDPHAPLAPTREDQADHVPPGYVECRWGAWHGRKGSVGCNENPVGAAVVWTSMAALTTSISAYCLANAQRSHNGHEYVCGGAAAFFGAAFWGLAGMHLYQVARPRELIPKVTASVSDKGFAFAAIGTF